MRKKYIKRKNIGTTVRLWKLDVRRRINPVILMFLLVEGVSLSIALFMDINSNCKIKLYEVVSSKIIEKWPTVYEDVLRIKHLLANNLGGLLNVILTLGTILAAAVIFFYSVQDSKKNGIPHRAILAYSSGSLSVPILFFIATCMIPFNYITLFLHFRWFTWMGLVFTYMTQMIIISIILKSTSHKYSIRVIRNAEIRQYKRHMVEEKEILSRGEALQNSLFIDTYLLHHLEQVISSDELISDKMEMVRHLVRIPYYDIWGKRIYFFHKRASVTPLISKRKLLHNDLKCIYEFYYINFIMVFQCMKRSEDKEERNKVYLILYEFMEELTKVFERTSGKGDSDLIKDNKCRMHYSMAICGILNAVMESNVEESGEFCNFVFNNVISQKVWNFHIGLYIFFQEYLHQTNEEAIRLNDLQGINNLEKWNRNISQVELEMYAEFWGVWMEFTTLTEYMSCQFFINVLRTLVEDADGTEVIEYIRLKIRG